MIQNKSRKHTKTRKIFYRAEILIIMFDHSKKICRKSNTRNFNLDFHWGNFIGYLLVAPRQTQVSLPSLTQFPLNVPQILYGRVGVPPLGVEISPSRL